MAIGSNAVRLFAGTRTEVSVTTPGSVATLTFSVEGDTVDWTNSDNAPLACAELECQFATLPSVGAINLHCQIKGTQPEPVVDSQFVGHPLGAFPVDYNAGVSTNFTSKIPLFELPWFEPSQILRFYLRNGTGQTVSSGWNLWITPLAYGPVP